jgi:hypothetical protein
MCGQSLGPVNRFYPELRHASRAAAGNGINGLLPYSGSRDTGPPELVAVLFRVRKPVRKTGSKEDLRNSTLKSHNNNIQTLNF